MRFWACLLLLGIAMAAPACPAVVPPKGKPPISGIGSPELEAFDRLVPRLMDKYFLPGAALAIAKGGRLVLSRGYGWAIRETETPVTPNTRFRLASLSKPITAVAVLHQGERLVQQGVYRNIAEFLAAKPLPELYGQPTDPRAAQISLRDLLQHSAGWNRNLVGDWLFRPQSDLIAKATGLSQPLQSNDYILYALSRPLQYAPGTRSVYSNMGYVLLSKLLELYSGKSYDETIQELARQMGVRGIEVGATHPRNRLPNEVRYYDFPGAPLVTSVLDGSQTSRPYGDFALEALAGAGALVASAPELVRFVAVLEGLRLTPSPLSAATRAEMIKRPTLAQYQGTASYYALGWGIKSTEQGLLWSHNGTFAGSRSLLLRTPSGVIAAILFNSRPWNDGSFIAELERSLLSAIEAVERWPEWDCFFEP